MIWRSSEILGCTLHAIHGSIGSIDDLMFDDTNWRLRWAVVDTGKWLPRQKVLLRRRASEPTLRKNGRSLSI